MTMLKSRASALALFLALAGPAVSEDAADGWSMDVAEDAFGEYYFTYADDDTGTVQLEIGCAFDYDLEEVFVYVVVFTGEAYDPDAAYDDTAPLTITADGTAFSFDMNVADFQGEVGLRISEFHNREIYEAVGAFELTGTPLVLSFGGAEFSVTHEGAGPAIGAVLDECW